ncbi:DNA polymerase III subunit delta [Anthocerotibacter panamensis]|uniref:DNA polymerase III subunit delta n=1 Tax=Anthocerotibacter panamensis TaxID=2857077 RepID=UPI001C405F0F|nr:DNA polymerase III subunit delta [Anthocerotibacter panamensis]
MPAYLFWGEDRFALLQAIQALREKVVDSSWQAFNDQRFGDEETSDALNESVTPPFGTGGRMVVVEGSRLFQNLANEGKDEPKDNRLLPELERTLTHLPETNHLVFMAQGKANRKLKPTKLLEKHGQVQEFALIPSWKEDELTRRVQALARTRQVRLTPEAVQYLVEALGNDTARLHNEMGKLALFPATAPLGLAEVRCLVVSSAHTSFQLAEELVQGATGAALNTLAQLTRQNEPALKVCAVLTNQFRTWLWVRLLVEKGVDDPVEIAEQAQIGNPKRVYILKKQVQNLTSRQLLACLPILLALEEGLKRGQPSEHQFTQAILEMSVLFTRPSARLRS